MRETTQIIINEQDWLRLEKVLSQAPLSPYSEWLESELARAKVIPSTAVSPGLVTMHSKVRYRDESTGKEKEVILVYPHEADLQSGKVSILAPVGAALLGLSVGQTIEWSMPDGKTKSLRVSEVLYQPENSDGAEDK